MTEFFVRYHSHTPVSFITRAEEQENPKVKMDFEFGPDTQIEILNSFVVSDGDILHTGLNFDFRIQRSDRDLALDVAGDIADDLVSLIAFTTNTEVADPERMQAFEWERSEENKFTQNVLVQPRPVYSHLSQINLDFYKRVLSLVYSDGQSESDKRKLMRAFYHYRKSLNVERAEDEFLNLFIALDAIEYLLRGIYGTKTIKFDCDECGGVAATDTDKASGRKALYNESEFLDANFGKIRDARHQLFHAGKKEKAVDYIEELRAGFRTGIAAIVGLDIEEYLDQINEQKTTTLKDHLMIFEGKLEDFDPSEVDTSLNVPAVDAEIDLDLSIENGGNISNNMSYSIEIHAPNDANILGESFKYSYLGNIGELELIEHIQD